MTVSQMPLKYSCMQLDTIIIFECNRIQLYFRGICIPGATVSVQHVECGRPALLCGRPVRPAAAGRNVSKRYASIVGARVRALSHIPRARNIVVLA